MEWIILIMTVTNFMLVKMFHNNAYNPIEGRLKLIVLNKENVNLNGEVVEIEMIQLKDGRKKNSVDFDYDRHLRSQGFDGFAYVNLWNIKPLGKRVDGVRYLLHHMRNEVYTDLRLCMTKEDADLGFGMLLGETSFMEKEVKRRFCENGDRPCSSNVWTTLWDIVWCCFLYAQEIPH